MYPIGHVPHHPCAPSPKVPISICSINHDTPLTMFAIAHVSYVMPMYPIGHVPRHPYAPSPKVPHLCLQY